MKSKLFAWIRKHYNTVEGSAFATVVIIFILICVKAFAETMIRNG